MTDTLTSQFREVCGLGSPLELRLQGERAVAPIRASFDAPFAVLGRDRECADLALEGEDVSRRHAYLQVVAGRLLAIDLESRTGTCWDSGPSPWGWVGRDAGPRVGGWAIRLGDATVLDASGWPEDLSNPTSSRPGSHRRLPPLILEFPKHRQLGRWPMWNALALIGRSPSCRVRLDDLEVSRFHASLLRTPSGPWVVDLGGRGGIAWNGERVRFAPLGHGDELEIGPFRIRALLAEAQTLPARRERPGPASLRTGALPSPAGDDPVRPLRAAELAMGDPMLAQMGLWLGRQQQEMFACFQEALETMGRTLSRLFDEQKAEVREELARLRELSRELSALRDELSTSTRREAPMPAESNPERVPPPASAVADTHDQADGTQADRVRQGLEIHDRLMRKFQELQKEQQTRWKRVLGLVGDRTA